MLPDDLIAQIGEGLDSMPPKPASRLEIELLLTRIESKIRAAQERGSTYAEIAKQISDCGYPIKSSTLRVALQRRRKKDPVMKRAARRNVPTALVPVAKAGIVTAQSVEEPGNHVSTALRYGHAAPEPLAQ